MPGYAHLLVTDPIFALQTYFTWYKQNMITQWNESGYFYKGFMIVFFANFAFSMLNSLYILYLACCCDHRRIAANEKRKREMEEAKKLDEQESKKEK